MALRARSVPGPRSFLLAGFGLIVAAVYALALSRQSTYETWSPLVVGPLLFLVSLPILARQARRERDARLFRLLVLALAVKFGGAVLRYYTTFALYQGSADAVGYFGWGRRLSGQFLRGDFSTGLDSLSGTDFIRFASGIVQTVTGPSMLAAFLVFSWLAFWGLFFFYRAFTIGVPEGRQRTYAHFVFFLPTLLFWPSSIGKESWMIFALGIAAFGIARILSGSAARGLLITILGLSLAALVRPHIAGLLAIALAVGYVIGRPRGEKDQWTLIRRVASLVPLIILAAIFIGKTNEYLAAKGIDTDQGPTAVVVQAGSRVTGGGSAFVPDVLESPAQFPLAVVTVLFRPFLFEVNNAQAAASAIEGSFLLVLCVIRLKWLLAAVRSIRRQAYVAFALVYTGMFVFAFSSIANFGLLVRQRTSLLPLFLVLLSVPPVRQSESSLSRELLNSNATS